MGTSQRYRATTNTKDQHGNVPSLITFSSRNHGRRAHTPCACFCSRASLYVHTHTRTYTVASHAVRWRKSKSLGRLKASRDDLLRSTGLSHVSLKNLYGPNRRRSRRFSPFPFSPVLVSDEAGHFAKPSTHVRDPPTAPGGSSFT